MPKKPLYTGDPNNPFTMCYKKHRRHNLNDVQLYVGTSQAGEEKQLLLCRHCREWLIAPKQELVVQQDT